MKAKNLFPNNPGVWVVVMFLLFNPLIISAKGKNENKELITCYPYFYLSDSINFEKP